MIGFSLVSLSDCTTFPGASGVKPLKLTSPMRKDWPSSPSAVTVKSLLARSL